MREFNIVRFYDAATAKKSKVVRKSVIGKNALYGPWYFDIMSDFSNLNVPFI